MLTRLQDDDNIKKSPKAIRSLKIEQNIKYNKTSNSFERLRLTQSNLRQIKLFSESLILAQDERWRRA